MTCGCPKPSIHYSSDFDARICNNCGVVVSSGFATEIEDQNVPFTHLRVHTHLSLLRGICKTEDLISKAKEYGMTSLAKTEFDTLCGAPSFVKDCLDNDLKPILGTEFKVRFSPDLYWQVTFIALNKSGYKNLVRLNTIAWCQRKDKDRGVYIELNDVTSDGLVALIEPFCENNETNIQLQKYMVDQLRQRVETYIEITRDNEVIAGIVKRISKELNLPIVVTGNVLYLHEDDVKTYEIALKIGKYEPTWLYDDNWFKPPDRFSQLFGFEDEWIENSQKIADRVEDYGIINKNFIVPTYKENNKVYSDINEVHQKLEMQAWTGLYNKGLADKQEYVDRLTYELGVMKDKKFSSYFLIINEIIEYMKATDKLKPIGRGSSVGSLVCYVLDITSMDPIQWGVPFERFINAGRIDLPDIDTDITQEGRQDVLKHIADIHGSDRVAQIATFQTLKLKAAIDNVGRALQVPHVLNKDIRKEISDEEDDIDLIADSVKEAMAYKPEWTEAATSLMGTAKNLGYHAAGVVISNEPLQEMVPLLLPESEGDLVGIQYDMRDCEILGLLKLDMLGLKTLDVIQHTLKRIEERYGVEAVPDIYNLPVYDETTYDLISNAEYVSIFQLDSTGYRRLCRQLKPRKFEHIMALNALFRPGPLEGGMTEEYVERRHGRAELVGWHPWLDEILEPTYQVPVYQEQVMAIAKIIAGFDDVEADKYRKAIGKKCLTLDSKLTTSSGVRVTVEDLINNKHLLNDLKFILHDGNLGGKWKIGKLRNIRSTGKRKIYNIWTKSGRRIRCTSNHKIPVLGKSFVKASKLNIGDYLFRQTKLTSRYNISSKKCENKYTNKALLLGLLTGDGRCTTSTIAFIQNDGKIADLFCNLINNIEYATYIKDIRSNPSGVPIYRILSMHPSKNFIKDLIVNEGLNKTAKHKSIPLSVKYSTDSEYIRAFLCGLLMSDGFIFANPSQNGGYIGYSSHSYDLMSDVQYLLSLFGINSTIRRKRYKTNINNKYYKGVTYECAIRDKKSILLSYKFFKPYIVGYKLKSLNKINKYANKRINSNSQIDKWPGYINDIIKSQENFVSFTSLNLRPGQIKNGITHNKFQRLRGKFPKLDSIIDGNILPDEIVDIQVSEPEPTFDLETNNNKYECYIANDIVIHNSKIQFDAAQAQFKEGALKRDGLEPPSNFNGTLEKWIDDLLDRLAGYARYGWNSGHSAGYGWITYITAYLEARFPHEYYASLLDSTTNSKKIPGLLRGILFRGFDVVPPNVNESGIKYDIGTDEKIYMGLSAIKSVGKAAQQIIEERDRNGKFKSFIDFCQRIPSINKTVKVNLVKAGAFSWDKMMCDRDKVDNVDVISKIARKRNKSFDGSKASPFEIAMQCHINGFEYTDIQKHQNERAVLNSFITGHPAAVYHKLSSHLERGNSKIICPSDINNDDICQIDDHVLLIGMVDMIRTKTIKNGRNEGKPYITVNISDNHAFTLANIWYPLCDEIKQTIAEGQIAMFECTLRKDKYREGFRSLQVRGAISLAHGLPIQGVFCTNGNNPSSIAEKIGGMVNQELIISNRKFASLRGMITVTPDILKSAIDEFGDDVSFMISMDSHA